MITLILWAAIHVAAMALIVACSLMRCRHCGGWHDSKEDEQQCRRNHET